MHYPIIIHKDPESDYGVTVPDFPGVFTGGETIEEAIANVQDAIETWFMDEEPPAMLPIPSPLEQVRKSELAANGFIAVAPVDFTFLERKTTPVNITLPVYMRERIDNEAKKLGLTRSAFLLKAAMAYMK